MEFIDHGDPYVDECWRKLLHRPKTPMATFINCTVEVVEGDFIDYVPPEFRDHGTLPDSLFICEAIPNGPEDV